MFGFRGSNPFTGGSNFGMMDHMTYGAGVVENRVTPEQVVEYYKKQNIPANYQSQTKITSLKIQDGGNAFYVNGDQEYPFMAGSGDGPYYYDIVKYVQDGGKVEPEYTDEDILNDAKNKKKEQINSVKESGLVSNVKYKDKEFAGDEYTKNTLTSVQATYRDPKETDASKQPLPDGFTWIAVDNTRVPMTMADIRALGQLLAEKVNVVTMVGRVLKDKIAAAKSVAEVDAINWPEDVNAFYAELSGVAHAKK